MLTDPDVLLLKLALEQEILSSAGYRQVLELVRKSNLTGGVGRALRQVGIAGDKVAALAEKVQTAVSDPDGAILARCDLEDALSARALERSKLVTEERLARAKNELKGLARTGELTSLSEVLVKRRWLEVPTAVELRRRARDRVATCARCFLQYIVEPDKARDGRFRCRTCGTPLEGGKGCHSAVELARGISPEKPPPPIEASQLMQLSPEQQQALAEARERGMAREAAVDKRPQTGKTEMKVRSERETVHDETAKLEDRRPQAPKPVTDDEPKAARWESVHDFAEKEPPVSAAVASFGEYEILSEVARGGMGIIYKARRKGAQKILALKVLISGVDATKEQVERFEREGENARKLRHPNIVRVYDAGRHEGYHYIAMEFVEGDTLELQLSKGSIEPRRAARIIRDVARAVDHIHQAGIIHRDLKPGNIILNDADAPKLIDFGLAKTIDRRARLTRSGASIGTPYYMPPEQVRGDHAKVGPSSDVYALGAILFEMLAGEVPFKAENPVELYHKIASSELVLPSTLKEGLPDALVTIVAHSMEKEPSARYATASALAEDLDRFLKGEAVQAKRVTRVTKAMKRARKRAWKVIFGLICGALVVGGALVAKIELSRHERMGRALVEVDLARALAGQDREKALAALERADEDGLSDASLLETPELKPLADDPRFKAVYDHVKARR